MDFTGNRYTVRENVLKYHTPQTDRYLNEKLKNGEKISVIGTLRSIGSWRMVEMTNKAYSKSAVGVIHLYYSATILEFEGSKGFVFALFLPV